MANKNPNYFTAQIKIPIHIKERIYEIAKKENRSINNLTSTILINYVESVDNKKRA